MMQVNDTVTLTGTVFAVPDYADERVPLNIGPVQWEVVGVQPDATLIRERRTPSGTVYAVLGHERERLKLEPLTHDEHVRRSREGRARVEAEYDAEHGEGAYTRYREAKAAEGRMMVAAHEYDATRDEVLASVAAGPRTLDANEHRIIIAALETYQSMWAAAVSEARNADDVDPVERRRDEELAQGRYDETGELLAKFKRDPEGASPAEMMDKLDANIKVEQARDRELARR